MNGIEYFEYYLSNEPFSSIFQFDQIRDSPSVVNTINPHSFITAETDLKFKKALLRSDFLLVDGIGLKLILLFFRLKNIKNLNGVDLHSYLIQNFRLENLNVFYFGSSSEVVENIKHKLIRECPNWNVKCLSPPFKSKFDESENDYFITEINSHKPDILFVGMTAPKQEKWVFDNYEKIQAKYIVSIGAVFDFYSGCKPSPPAVFSTLKLIWLFRLFTDFKHVWRRTFVSLPKFIIFNILNSGIERFSFKKS